MTVAKPPRTARQIIYRVLAAVIGVVFIGAHVVERMDMRRIRAAGKTAVVAPITEYTERTSRGTKSYYAEFKFTTETGQQVQRRHAFPEEVLADFQQQRPVKVRYDPKDPSEFIFEQDSPSWITLGGGMTFLAIALFVL